MTELIKFCFDFSSAPLSVGSFTKNNKIYYIKDSKSPESMYDDPGIWIRLPYQPSETKECMLELCDDLASFGVNYIIDKELIYQMKDSYECGDFKAPHYLAWVPNKFNEFMDVGIPLDDFKLIVEYWIFGYPNEH